MYVVDHIVPAVYVNPALRTPARLVRSVRTDEIQEFLGRRSIVGSCDEWRSAEPGGGVVLVMLGMFNVNHCETLGLGNNFGIRVTIHSK